MKNEDTKIFPIEKCVKHYVILYRYRIDSFCIATIEFTTCNLDEYCKELKYIRKCKDYSIVSVSRVLLPTTIQYEKRIKNIFKI